MPIVPMSPPQAVAPAGGFDYVAVDPAHRRVYAAHLAARSLLVVDADTGKILSQIRVGPLHGVAVDRRTGHVFTGNGEAGTISEVDPVASVVVRSVNVGAAIDAIAYDAGNRRVYADEDDGNRLFVIDASSFKLLRTVALPGHKLEYLAVDPESHAVYQNIGDRPEIAVVDAHRLNVESLVPTPGLTGLHGLQYDAARHVIITVAANGLLGGYRTDGTTAFRARVPTSIDQCDLDRSASIMACAGMSRLSVYDLSKRVPRLMDVLKIGAHLHTVAVDSKTHTIWAVWGSRQRGDFIQRFSVSPLPTPPAQRGGTLTR